MNMKKSHYKYLFISFIIFTLPACTEQHHQPLTIASSPWPGYEPLYLARDLGYFKKNKIKVFELPSSDITMESFRNGSTDLASLTLDETLELIHDGVKLRILLIMDISNGGDAVMAKPEIKKLSDIKGKNISIVNIPLGLYVLNRLIDKAGLKREDVNVFPMADVRQVQFYKQGKADVVVTYDPTKTQLEKLGLHVLFDSSDIPNEIFDILVVQEDVYKKRFKEVCAVGKQWFKTLEYIKDNNTEAAKQMGKRLGVSHTEFNKMMEGLIVPSLKENEELLAGENPGIILPAENLVNIMLTEKQLTHHSDIKMALDKNFIACVK